MTEGPMPGGHDHATAAAAGSAAGPTAGSTPGSSAADDARRAQLLSTEHWSLLASRSMTWNEAFSRTGTFLSTLSAATVALALAGPAMSFGGAFALFALIVLSVTLFLGIATFVRLVQVNNEDLYWVTGMNLIRGEYARLSPGIEKSFVAGHTLDTEGIARTFAAFDVTSNVSPFHMLITTPAIVAVISSAIAGVIAGLLVIQFGHEVVVALAAGAIVFVGSVLISISYGRREARRYIARAIQSRLPTSIDTTE